MALSGRGVVPPTPKRATNVCPRPSPPWVIQFTAYDGGANRVLTVSARRRPPINALTLFQAIEAIPDHRTKKAAEAGKCFDNAMKEVRLPKYEGLNNYGIWLPGNVERYCGYWGRGF